MTDRTPPDYKKFTSAPEPKKDGGPAFSIKLHGDTYSGMSLRDYFAAKAMQKMVEASDNKTHANYIAEFSYTLADAMIKERNK